MTRFSSSEGIKEGYPQRNQYFTAINSSNVRTVANRHRHAAYHNKHFWRTFRGTKIDDLERSWTREIRGFSEFFRDFSLLFSHVYLPGGRTILDTIFAPIDYSSVNTVADRQKQALLTSFPGYHVDDLKPLWNTKYRVLVNFSRFQAAMHISRVNGA